MFETPLFLIAAALGAMIPLLLHLMQKRRSTPTMFPTLRFLLLAQKSSSRRIRIEHLLLWLLRTLIMLLLGAAFAMPMLRAKGLDFLGQAPRDVAIVIDASYSMGYQAGRDTVWDRALAIATSLVEGLGENDRYCIYVAREQPQALIAEPIADKEVGMAQLNALRLGHETSLLGPAIDAAYAALRKATSRRQRELHVLTDNQSLPWSDLRAEEAGEDDTWRTDRDTALFVSMLGVTAPENVAPREIELLPPVLYVGSGARLEVRLGHSGPPRETTVSLHIDGREQARRSVLLGTPQADQIVFALPPLPEGIHLGRVETPVDNLPVDDAFHFLIRVRDEMPALIVGGESDTFFLRAALRASSGGGEPLRISPEEVSPEAIEGYSCIFLCNALPMSGQALATLERYVQRGGLLVVFPGLRATVEDYRAWRALPGVPVEVRDVPRAQSRQTLFWNEPEHLVIRALREATATPAIAVQRALVWEDLAEDAKPLISLSDKRPLLLERPYGQGRVLLFAVGADRGWSNLPLTPFYLPIVVQLIEYSGGLGASPPFHWGDAMFPVEAFLPDARPGISLLDPQGRTVALRSTVREGEMALHAESMREPGIYHLAGPDGPQPVAAINLPREESDLTPIAADALAELIGVEDLLVAIDRESLEALLHEHRVGRTYGELLLWIVLLLAGSEFIYANRLARVRRGLGEQLSIAPSGRVSGHVATGSEGGAS